MVLRCSCGTAACMLKCVRHVRTLLGRHESWTLLCKVSGLLTVAGEQCGLSRLWEDAGQSNPCFPCAAGQAVDGRYRSTGSLGSYCAVRFSLWAAAGKCCGVCLVKGMSCAKLQGMNWHVSGTRHVADCGVYNAMWMWIENVLLTYLSVWEYWNVLVRPDDMADEQASHSTTTSVCVLSCHVWRHVRHV
jgi:hypothetical protein